LIAYGFSHIIFCHSFFVKIEGYGHGILSTMMNDNALSSMQYYLSDVTHKYNQILLLNIHTKLHRHCSKITLQTQPLSEHPSDIV
jgi:hypothetical protein